MSIPVSSLPIFAMTGIMGFMATMNVSVPDTLKSFVETQVETEGYGTSSEYIRQLIRKDRQRAHLRALIMVGVESETVAAVVDDAFWEARRNRLK
jgi:antitoxin ParD1/3/4